MVSRSVFRSHMILGGPSTLQPTCTSRLLVVSGHLMIHSHWGEARGSNLKISLAMKKAHGIFNLLQTFRTK